MGGLMGERRKAKRYDVYVPLQVCMPGQRSGECHTAQLRDISRLGVFFQSIVSIETGARLELTFALPTESDHAAPVLVRASARAVRVDTIEQESTPIYGVAATIDRIDFVRPAAATHAAA